LVSAGEASEGGEAGGAAAVSQVALSQGKQFAVAAA
jgi:hypothetical protein